MFTLKIFLMGMVALVPSPDGRELTVLVVDGRKGYTASDRTVIEPHQPFLVARASRCTGHCDRGDSEMAEFLVARRESAALDVLQDALGGGTIWRLSDSEISFDTPSPGQASAPLILTRSPGAASPRERSRLPHSLAEAQDLSWVADLNQIAPTEGVDPDALAPYPTKGWVVARLKVASGRVSTYRLAGAGDQVIPVEFRGLGGNVSAFEPKALADSVMIEVEIAGDTLELRDGAFAAGVRRKVHLTPQNGTIELALLNVPASHAAHAGHVVPGAGVAPPAPGKHFELLFELAKRKPAPCELAVPHAASGPGVAWSQIYRGPMVTSELLRRLGLDQPRTVYDVVLCPVGGFGTGR